MSDAMIAPRAKGADMLEEFERRHRDRVERVVAEMRAEGLEPASREGEFGYGATEFAFSARPVDASTLELRVHASSPDMKTEVRTGGRWPRHGVMVATDEFLADLTDRWPSLAAPYLEEDGVWPSETVLPFGPVERLVFSNVDGHLVVSNADASVDLKTSGVVAIESLKVLGDEIARRELASKKAIDAWSKLSDRTDLPPATIDPFLAHGFDDANAAEMDERQTRWYAARFGMNVDRWSDVASYLEACQTLFATGARAEEPSADDWRPDATVELPDDETLRTLVSDAAAARAMSVDEFRAAATHDRNSNARGVTVWEREKERIERERSASTR